MPTLSRSQVLLCYVATLSLAAMGSTAAFAAVGPRLGAWAPVLVLAGIAMYVEAQPVRVAPTVEVSVASTVYIFAGVLFGPLAAAIVGASGLLVVWRERDVEGAFLRWLTWTASRILVAGLAGTIAVVVEGGARTDPARLFAAVAAASATDLVGDLVLSPIPPAIRRRARWSEQVGALLPIQASALPFHIPLIGLLAYVYMRVSPWSVALFVIPVLAAQRLLVLYHHQRATSEELAYVNRQLAASNLSFATALVATLDARDRYTAGHSAAVAIYARDIARRLGLTEAEQESAHLCGLVHDIGKVGLPVGLLEKKGSLTLEERRLMEAHSTIGERILRNVESYGETARIVRHHHERVDGLGYPDGLVGDHIPLISRIISVADAYNAMTSDRPYRDAMPSQIARVRLAQAVETQFDTTVVAAFEAVLATASDDYKMGRGLAFTIEAQQIDTALAADAA